MLLSVLVPKGSLWKAKRLDFGFKENDVTSLEQACTKTVHILYILSRQHSCFPFNRWQTCFTEHDSYFQSVKPS